MNKFEFDEYGKTGYHVVHDEKRLDEEVNLGVLRKIDACKCSCYNGLDYFEYGAVQTALEKQVPMRPLKYEIFKGDWYYCPRCENAIRQRIGESKHDIQYCPFCGQKLKWKKDEESEDDESVGLTD